MKREWFIGIDISKNTLDFAIVNVDDIDGKRLKHFQVSNNLKGFKRILGYLKGRKMELSKVIVCMENTGIYGLEFCLFLETKNIPYSVVNALEIKSSMGIKRGKNDKVDSIEIAIYAHRLGDRLKTSLLPSDDLLKLKFLQSERDRIKKAETVEKNVISELGTKYNKNVIKRSKRRLRALERDLKEVEKEILEIIKSNQLLRNTYNLITSVTGIGLVNAITFIIYTNNFTGIRNARKYACYCGVAPFEHSSGTSIRGKTRVSKLANVKIKSNLSLAAKSSILHDPEMRIYYDRKKGEGKEYGCVLNAVKFKLITRVFAVISRGTPYVKLRCAG